MGVVAELRRLDREARDTPLVVQDALGPYLNRTNQSRIPADLANAPLPVGALVVYAPEAPVWGPGDPSAGVGPILAADPDRFARLPDYRRLRVYRVQP